MGTWGPHSFDNDDARDWCQAYREMGLFVAKSTMDVALGDARGGGLQADVASRAIAAAEAVCFAVGRGSPEAVEAFANAPDADPTEAEALVPVALDVIDVVKTGSELSALWSEAGPTDHQAWVASLEALKLRVGGQPQVATSDESATMPASASSAETADLHAAVAALTREVQDMRQEMRDALVELARRIGGRST